MSPVSHHIHNKPAASLVEQTQTETNCKRVRKEDGRENISPHPQKKQYIEDKNNSDAETLSAITDESDTPKIKEFLDLLPEIKEKVISFMPPESQQNFALASKESHGMVIDYRMATDLRKLQNRTFVNGLYLKMMKKHFITLCLQTNIKKKHLLTLILISLPQEMRIQRLQLLIELSFKLDG